MSTANNLPQNDHTPQDPQPLNLFTSDLSHVNREMWLDLVADRENFGKFILDSLNALPPEDRQWAKLIVVEELARRLK